MPYRTFRWISDTTKSAYFEMMRLEMWSLINSHQHFDPHLRKLYKQIDVSKWNVACDLASTRV